MKYRIRATFTVEAESKQKALEIVAACVSYWDEKTGIYKLQGVGGAKGYVSIDGTYILDSRAGVMYNGLVVRSH